MNQSREHPFSIYDGKVSRHMTHDGRIERFYLDGENYTRHNGIFLVGEGRNQQPHPTLGNTVRPILQNDSCTVEDCSSKQLRYLIDEIPHSIGMVLFSAFSPQRRTERIDDVKRCNDIAWQLREHNRQAFVGILASLSPAQEELLRDKLNLPVNTIELDGQTVNSVHNIVGESTDGSKVPASAEKIVEFLEQLRAITSDSLESVAYDLLHRDYARSMTWACDPPDGNETHQCGQLSNDEKRERNIANVDVGYFLKRIKRDDSFPRSWRISMQRTFLRLLEWKRSVREDPNKGIQ